MNEKARSLVDKHVYCNVSPLVEFALSQPGKDSPIGWEEDITNMYPDPWEWDIERCQAYIEDEIDADAYAEMLADLKADGLESEELEEQLLDDLRNYISDNAQPREPLEWWAVSDWLAWRLSELGEVMIDLPGYVHIWGRTTSGQAIYLDGIIENVAVKHPLF